SRGRSARGAGLEIELAEVRRGHPAIPAHLLGRLPPRGPVNPAEAQAVLSILERLHADADLLAEAKAWQEAHDGPAVAVLSCFPAQASLLSALLPPSPLRLAALAPERLRGRGCWGAVVSLVRSGATQALPFSSHPDELALMLGRPASRLWIVGDPGSVLRRGQWFGKLEPQGDAVAPHEQALMQALAAAWPDRMASAFVAETGKPQRSRESSSV
ncbi:MAG: hypothetical protein K2W96_15100, partial [Gemmataceae bacterium]|nr:hypothetical protein [Gemmataceae bacterium]